MSHSKRFDQVQVGDEVVLEGQVRTVDAVGYDKNNMVRVECGLNWYARERNHHVQYIPKIENE